MHSLMPSLIFINAVVSILFNQSIKLDEKDLANNAELLMTNVVPHVWDNTMNPPPGILSDATANLLNTSDFTLYDLSDSMFQNEDPTIYPRLLNAGCSKFYNDGLTCEGTDFYEPSEVRGGIVGIMTKCLMIRGDKCKQCQCIANNALFNHAVPEKITSKIADKISTVWAIDLESVKKGNIDFGKWFDIYADATVGVGFDMYPSLIGFLVGVFMSMVMVLLINTLDHRKSMILYQRQYRQNHLDTVRRCSLLFQSEDQGPTKTNIKSGIFFVLGIGIIPFIVYAVYLDMFILRLSRVNEFINLENEREFEYSMIDLVWGIRDGSARKSEFTGLYAILLLVAPM